MEIQRSHGSQLARSANTERLRRRALCYGPFLDNLWNIDFVLLLSVQMYMIFLEKTRKECLLWQQNQQIYTYALSLM